MPQHDHIAVRVLVDEEPLREYPLPEGEDSEGGDHHCYIEAVVGQRFQVEVEWLPGFHLQHAPFLYAAIRVDDQEDNWFNWEGTEGMPHRKGRISQQYSCRFDHFPARNEYGDWKRVYRTFGALGIGTTCSAALCLQLTLVQMTGMSTTLVSVPRCLRDWAILRSKFTERKQFRDYPLISMTAN